MKKAVTGILAIALLAAFAAPAFAENVRVRGHYRPSTGTYVAPYNRTSPDRNPYNNYGTQGNYNPYTGRVGTRPAVPRRIFITPPPRVRTPPRPRRSIYR